MTSATIRSASTKDWPTLERLLRDANLPADDIDAGHAEQFLVAENSDATPPAISGLIGLQSFGRTGLLRSLVVHADQRGAGTGRRLVAALEKKAGAAGITDLWLLTIDAEVFFWKLDYRIAERSEAPDSIKSTQEYKSLCPGSAHLMHKKL